MSSINSLTITVAAWKESSTAFNSIIPLYSVLSHPALFSPSSKSTPTKLFSTSSLTSRKPELGAIIMPITSKDSMTSKKEFHIKSAKTLYSLKLSFIKNGMNT